MFIDPIFLSGLKPHFLAVGSALAEHLRLLAV